MPDLRTLDAKSRRFFQSCLREAGEAEAAIQAHTAQLDKLRVARDLALAEANAELAALGIDPAKNTVRLTEDGKLEVTAKAAEATAPAVEG